MRRLASFTWIFFCFFITGSSFAQTAIQTSFETAEGYTAGTIHAQNNWTVSSGTAQISAAKANTGTQSLSMGAGAGTLLVNHVAYAGNVPGITGEVYADMWVNPTSFVTRGIAVNGMDLYGGSSKRIFVIEFATDGNIKAYNGSAAVNISTWTANTWVRISIKMDFATEKYRVAINTILHPTEFAFRETYTPTASGTRVAGVKEYHSLRFNHLADTNVGTTDAAFDDIYVGTTAIPGVAFGVSANTRTITVTQPAFGSISLSPAAGPYTLGQNITATLALPQGYMNNGWTGDLTGTELVKTFSLAGNMSFGADVGIDAGNPPPKYLVTLVQPANGSITLSPSSPDNMYYRETKVTATVTVASCYQFDGWSGDLSGTAVSNTFTVQNNVSVSANISLNNTTPVKRTTNTAAAFKAALNVMNPGDTVELENGTYDLSSFTITRSGCQLRPIVIMVKNAGQVILNGATALVFRNMEYTTLRGFKFKSTGIGTGIKLENCKKFRITENDFSYTETSSCTWVYIGDTYASPLPLRSGYNRVDHNIFDGKTQAGNYIRMDGNINQQSQYDTIDHNHFKNNGPRAANEKESIRVGVSTLSKSSGFTIIEYNLFEDCDGDPEIVSIKSCDNTIRYNTFVRCLGTLCLRQGFRSTAEGNYFFGDNKTGEFNGGTLGAGGIRVYGKDHKIINNYFSGLTGSKWDAAITITNGDVNNNSNSLADHYLPENLIVTHNTLVNNESNIEIGFNNNGSYPLSPINCMIADNVVIQNTTPVIKVHNAAALNGVAFSNNMVYPTGTATIGMTTTTAQVTVADPKLVAPICLAPDGCNLSNASKVLRLSASSPAIDAGTGNYPTLLLDNEQQPRTGVKDIGADEYNSASPVTVFTTALDAADVGPGAAAQIYSYILTGALPVKIINLTAAKHNAATRISWSATGEENETAYEIEWSSDGRNFIKTGQVPATRSSSLQYYFYDDIQHTKGTNFYRLRTRTSDNRFTYSAIVSVKYGVAVKVYPNPVNEKLVVEMDAAISQAQVTLAAADGRIVYADAVNRNGTYTIPVEKLPAGVYMLKVSSAKAVLISQKIIKQ